MLPLLTPTSESGLNPVPYSMSVKAAPPAIADAGLTLVNVSGAPTMLKLANTSDSSVGDNVADAAVPVKSKVHPPNVHPESGVSEKVNFVPDG